MIETIYFDYEPEPYKIIEPESETDTEVVVLFREDIRELSYEEWQVEQISVRVGREYATDEYVLEHKEELIYRARYDDAAKSAREKRDLLLAESDKYMMLDRMDFGSVTTFLAFLAKLKDILSGKYAMYRQALRDVPQQKGFPFEIEWPELPED